MEGMSSSDPDSGIAPKMEIQAAFEIYAKPLGTSQCRRAFLWYLKSPTSELTEDHKDSYFCTDPYNPCSMFPPKNRLEMSLIMTYN